MFEDGKRTVWERNPYYWAVDTAGNLHLKITKNANGQWTCAEIIGPTTYGYGTYSFALASRVAGVAPWVHLEKLRSWGGEEGFTRAQGE